MDGDGSLGWPETAWLKPNETVSFVGIYVKRSNHRLGFLNGANGVRPSLGGCLIGWCGCIMDGFHWFTLVLCPIQQGNSSICPKKKSPTWMRSRLSLRRKVSPRR